MHKLKKLKFLLIVLFINYDTSHNNLAIEKIIINVAYDGCLLIQPINFNNENRF